MLFKLFVLFIAVPLVELYLLVWLGTVTQVWVPVGLVVATAMVGAYLVKSQGRRAVQRIKQELEIGNIPHDPLLDGLFILIGGVVLLTPGVITDLIGISLLLPVTRALYRRKAKAWIKRKFATGQWTVRASIGRPPE